MAEFHSTPNQSTGGHSASPDIKSARAPRIDRTNNFYLLFCDRLGEAAAEIAAQVRERVAEPWARVEQESPVLFANVRRLVARYEAEIVPVKEQSDALHEAGKHDEARTLRASGREQRDQLYREMHLALNALFDELVAKGASAEELWR